MPPLSVDEVKAKVVEEIDRRGDEAVRLAEDILANPESGFRETETAKRVSGELDRLNLPYESGIGITGLKAVMDAGEPGPTVGIVGELDSMIVRDHPHGDPETEAAHACGHHVQIGSMLAAAMGLSASGVMESLTGRVALLAVPAEEYIEIEYRRQLRDEGKIEFLSGKQEFVRLGHMDDVDMAMMVHTVPRPGEPEFLVVEGNNGFVAKFVKFAGTAAHAGAAPHAGTNALNAAMIAMSAVHAQRETYRDEDTIRVHPIITQGGVAVSSVPADVRMETFVRGHTVDAFTSASQKVDRALRAGAMAVGGSVTVSNLPGHLPLRQDSRMMELFVKNGAGLVGNGGIAYASQWTGSTDMGDLSHLMPAIHPYVNAAEGTPHGADYLIHDYELGVLTGAKAMALTVVDLLANGARTAREVANRFHAPMTKAEYLSYLKSTFNEETYTE